jgi:hypothetical protein
VSPPDVHVYVPVRILVDPAALDHRSDDIDDALQAAVGRALATSSRVVDVTGAAAVRVHTAHVTWSGDGLGQVPDDIRARTVARVGVLLADASKTRLPAPRDPFARVTPRGAAALVVPGPAPVDFAALEARVEGPDPFDRTLAVYEVWDRMIAGDEAAFKVALLGVRSDEDQPTPTALAILAHAAERSPRRFLTTAASPQAYRTATDLVVDLKVSRSVETRLRTAATRVAHAVPQAAPLVRELEAALPGAARLAGLIQAYTTRYLQLAWALSASGEATDARVLATLSDRPRAAGELLGVVTALRTDPRLRAMAPALEADLVDGLPRRSLPSGGSTRPSTSIGESSRPPPTCRKKSSSCAWHARRCWRPSPTTRCPPAPGSWTCGPARAGRSRTGRAARRTGGSPGCAVCWRPCASRTAPCTS